ncbi:MAG: DNA translocase FtsK 4TM domain-containing protein [Deltaproteobacteria bacterium]|nr:DNA translocase FtsK 4TM domain-containing protein [Deltaproteobacteria bacterium]
MISKPPDLNIKNILEYKIEYLRFICAIFILIALISQGNFDPTPANLYWPSDGVENWLNLPGALFAGVFFDYFGWISILISFLMLFTQQQTKMNFGFLTVKHLFVVIFTSMMIAFLFPTDNSFIIPLTGFIGYMANLLSTSTTLRIMGIVILSLSLFSTLKNYRFDPLFFYLLVILGGFALKTSKEMAVQSVLLIKQTDEITRTFFYDLSRSFSPKDPKSNKGYPSSESFVNQKLEPAQVVKQILFWPLTLYRSSAQKREQVKSAKFKRKGFENESGDQNLIQQALKEYEKNNIGN